MSHTPTKPNPAHLQVALFGLVLLTFALPWVRGIDFGSLESSIRTYSGWSMGGTSIIVLVAAGFVVSLLERWFRTPVTAVHVVLLVFTVVCGFGQTWLNISSLRGAPTWGLHLFLFLNALLSAVNMILSRRVADGSCK